MLIFGSNLSAVNNVKSLLGNNFDMKDLGEASVILGIKITRSEKGISLDQSHYVEKILKKYGYFDCKPACTPYDPSVKLFKNTAIAKIENRFYNSKRRQIKRKHSTVRELITTGAVRVDHVRTNDNLADPLTIGLASEKVQNTSVKMGLMPMK
ncbi:uncharacterized mitochondrial protein AtMg00810-like [Trifolium pratense]|uniref:Uncharacterized protein n=1 Tax=Trifolium pratense TaxID=57577 RepID=A0ACB0K539_TRIPR|nr:uncharacterized mitochondrial protein AtMg00810-like [Trifolium pratense]CAJ2651717.1 unnamed protein product [Trifolium pratense]